MHSIMKRIPLRNLNHIRFGSTTHYKFLACIRGTCLDMALKCMTSFLHVFLVHSSFYYILHSIRSTTVIPISYLYQPILTNGYNTSASLVKDYSTFHKFTVISCFLVPLHYTLVMHCLKATYRPYSICDAPKEIRKQTKNNTAQSD
jgi:hypothetical protein